MVTKMPSDPTVAEQVLRILIIEDNPGDIILIRELLKTSGRLIDLSNATTLREAAELLNSNTYDVILLDLGLPDSSGLKTLKDFLYWEISPPVVVMTGLDDEDLALSALREGAQDYLVKNRLDSENILKSINYSIERKKLENLRRKNSHQLATLSDTTAALFVCDDISSIYNLICKSLRQLIPGALTVSVEFVSDTSFRLSNTDQFNRWEDQIAKISGIRLKNMLFQLPDQNPELLDLFRDGLLHHIEKGFYSFLEGRITYEQALDVEQLVGIKHTYAIGFLKNEFYYGGILLCTNAPIEDDDSSFVVNICSQASLSVHRQLIKRNLQRSEARYQRLAAELEQKVRERTNELEMANEQLRESETKLRELNATKDKFFNIVAHDLKNPFTSLLGATELLYHNIQNMDKEKIRKLAQILNESAKSGYAILLNLLDWSRSQTGNIKMNLQKVNLRKVIDENIADVNLNCIDKDITITSLFNQDMNINADKNMLNTVLRNLLSNAIKFTPRGGSIIVSGEVKDNNAFISVKDNGIGISKEHIGKLFRIDSKYSRPGTEKELGTGLGLKLSREFVEKLGGKIWVESTENLGSVFTFTIPFQDIHVIR